jgi:Protein of unknown function (DUF1648)
MRYLRNLLTIGEHPGLVLVLMCGLFAATLALSAYALPNRVASHFDLQGQPLGWMSRDSYQLCMAFTGVALPVFTLLITLLMRASPPELFSLPHRDYWLSPEHRAKTDAYFAKQFTWLACLLLGLMAGLNCLVVVANRTVPVRLSSALWGLIAVFLAAVHLWAILLVLRFSRPPPGSLPSPQELHSTSPASRSEKDFARTNQ